MVEQALLILLSNAINFSSRRGRVRIRLAGGTITVEDEGAGIKQVDLAYVFERFYRGGESKKGAGLGLSLCKEIIERMGGSITIDSREGVGTTVRIVLEEAG